MACAMREVCDPVDAQAFRLAMRRLAGGVSVVTVGALGARSGFTATSVVSLSVAPSSSHASSTRCQVDRA